MSSKKWMEYQRMTTVAKKFGGANKYQAILVLLGSVGTLTVEKLIQFGKKIIKKREKRTNDLDIENKYTVTTVPEELLDELGDGKDSIISGSQFIVSKVFILDGEKAAFIDIIGDENNPYLIKSETLEKISNYNSDYLNKVEE
ncbi:hypothetical protein O8I67_06805 [Streptococcus uberis]|uniref:hypothetical protein n=1 Tax=Streptococcus uberis TaxID=1349 RepID=UPI0022B8CE7F|nr:hypothetical protein [Streptococcus uberis]MCZ8466773.1 hypothetical protein [Streptococcus uberis]